MVNNGFDLPNSEEYELKKNQNRQRLQRQIKRSEDPNVEIDQASIDWDFFKFILFLGEFFKQFY